MLWCRSMRFDLFYNLYLPEHSEHDLLSFYSKRSKKSQSHLETWNSCLISVWIENFTDHADFLYVLFYFYLHDCAVFFLSPPTTRMGTTGISSLITKPRNYNWSALWKNRICSTTMKLRKSLVKPVTWQNISSYLVLLPKIIMQDTFNVILWTSANICIVHDDLGWNNWTTHYNCRFSAMSQDLRMIFSCRTTCYKRFCSRLEYIDIHSVY